MYHRSVFLGRSGIQNFLHETYFTFISCSGKVSIVTMCNWVDAKTDSKEDQEAAERAQQMNVSAFWV
jgi:hypothetical protein